MSLVAYPDQRVSEEMTGNLYNALHLVNTVNMDPCILLKGFQDDKETPTPNILCMCTDTLTCVSAHMWIHVQRSEVSVSIFLHSSLTFSGLSLNLVLTNLSRPSTETLSSPPLQAWDRKHCCHPGSFLGCWTSNLRSSGLND